MKSLGVMKYPKVTVDSFSGSSGTVILLIQTNHNKIRVKMGVSCVRDMVRLSKEIISKQKDYAQCMWNEHLELDKLRKAPLENS